MARGKGAKRAASELKVAGRNAVDALVRQRIEDVVRVYLHEDLVPDFGKLLKWCATNRRAYHIVDADELDRVAESVHHEGVVVIAREKPELTLDALLDSCRRTKKPIALVLLEDVKNPHNIGAILRVGAHFGVRALLVPRENATRLSNALLRTAEGGAEFVDIVRIDDIDDAIERLKAAGLRVFGTSSHVRDSIYDAMLPPRVVFLLGAEGEGMTRETATRCDGLFTIAGTGAVESLNVSTAAAIFLSEFWRTHQL